MNTATESENQAKSEKNSIPSPSKEFKVPFSEIINQCSPKITTGAADLLKRMGSLANKHDGEVHPKQNTLAVWMGCSVRSIKRYIRELLDCEYIDVIPPERGGIRRWRDSAQGATNRYKILKHPDFYAAEKRLSPPLSPPSEDSTFNNYNAHKKTIAPPDLPPGWVQYFNPLTLIEKNKDKNARAVLEAIRQTWEDMKKGAAIWFPNRYAQKIIDVQSPNYNEAEHMAQAREEAAQVEAGAALVTKKLKLKLTGMPGRARPKTAQDMNTDRNELLKRFGGPKFEYG